MKAVQQALRKAGSIAPHRGLLSSKGLFSSLSMDTDVKTPSAVPATPDRSFKYNLGGGPFVSQIPHDECSVNSPRYKVSFAGGDPENRKTFKQKRFIMPISIGQEFHENGRLRGTFERVAKSFEGGIILVDDWLQYHTLGIIADIPEDYLTEICLREGDEWLRRYKSLIDDTFGDAVEVVRWKDTTVDPPYEKNYQRVLKLLAEDPMYHEAFERNTYEFVGRLARRKPGLDQERAHERTWKYLKEECASMLGWPELFNVQVEVYPSDRNHAMAATNEMILRKIYPHMPKGLEKTGLRFKKMKVVHELTKDGKPASELVCIGEQTYDEPGRQYEQTDYQREEAYTSVLDI